MPEEWFEVAYINFDKAILHGRMMKFVINNTGNMSSARVERYVEQVLTASQKCELESLQAAHDIEMQRLLRSFVND